MLLLQLRRFHEEVLEIGRFSGVIGCGLLPFDLFVVVGCGRQVVGCVLRKNESYFSWRVIE